MTEPFFVRDFGAFRQRWTDFWEGKSQRPLVSIVLPKPGSTPVPKPEYMSGADGNFEQVAEQLLAYAETHCFLGEAIPFFSAEFGPDHFSALLGADMEFKTDSPNTRWIVPFVEDWDSAEIRFRRDSKWWKMTVEFLRVLKARCAEKVLIAAPTFVAGLDCLAAIGGVEKLLWDLIERPEQVKHALDAVNQAYTEILDAFAEELHYAEFGSVTRHGMYSTGKTNVPQCDFSCMISPKMFDEFEVPCLKWETTALDAAEYHLDGPDAIKHLESLCSVDGIGVIQWVSGTGNPQTVDWSELHRRIDSMGKGQILGAKQDMVKSLWRTYSSRRLFFTSQASSVEDAERFIGELEIL